MKKRKLLSTSVCYLIAAVAMAAEAPVSTAASSLQPPVHGKISGASSVSKNSSATKVAGPTPHTIAELYKNRAKLNKKKVIVHGQAVKVTDGIMGKSWIHIQDGTGDKGKGTNDVICIAAVPGTEVGDVVTITGTAIFNPKSRYKLVIVDATVNR